MHVCAGKGSTVLARRVTGQRMKTSEQRYVQDQAIHDDVVMWIVHDLHVRRHGHVLHVPRHVHDLHDRRHESNDMEHQSNGGEQHGDVPGDKRAEASVPVTEQRHEGKAELVLCIQGRRSSRR